MLFKTYSKKTQEPRHEGGHVKNYIKDLLLMKTMNYMIYKIYKTDFNSFQHCFDHVDNLEVLEIHLSNIKWALQG